MMRYNIFAATILLAMIVFLAKENSDLRKGLDSCIENVQEKCGPVTEYAIMLENENARLNKKIRKCNSLKSD